MMHRSFLGTACVSLSIAASAAAQQTGPSSSHPAYMLPSYAGVITRSILTVGDDTADLYRPGSRARLVGIPDGLAALDNGDDTFTLFVNHELPAGTGITRRHGATGAFVSAWTIRGDAAAPTVLKGGDFTRIVYLAGPSSWAPAQGQSAAMAKLCSADCPPISALFDEASGKGTRERLLLNGEETKPPEAADYGRAFATVLTGAHAGACYEVPSLGRICRENSLACPASQTKTIVVGMDDADRATDTQTPSELYVYVGEKRADGNEVEQAGLVGGALFGLQIQGESGDERRSRPPITDERINDMPSSAPFRMIPLGDASQQTGTHLQAESIRLGVTRFFRIEDGAWDPRPGKHNDFYFVTTDLFPGVSRLWRLRFDDLAKPEAGGVIELLLPGGTGPEMMDNVAFDRHGNLVIQEDPAPIRLACIWNYNVDTAALTNLAQADPKRFDRGALGRGRRAPEFLADNEESSGIIDASEVLGPGWFLLDVQCGSPNADAELVAGGQLLALFNPLSVETTPPNLK